ncbi:MAG: hypothetical protein ACXWLX_06525 [Rhizomicrobium sp.]
MVQGRRDKKQNEEAVEQPRFAPLDGSSWEDGGYLPSGDDQSWREMEALRIGAYDRIGHLPPRDNQSWREQEALHLSTQGEADEPGNHADDTGNAGDAGDPIAELAAPDPVMDPVSDLGADPVPEPPDANPESYVPVRETIPEFQTARRGAGGVMLLLVSVVGLVTVALAVPDILTPDFWRAQWAAARSVAQPAAVPEQRVANIPPPAPVVRPAILPAPPPPAPDNGPAVNTQPPANGAPNAEPGANAPVPPPAAAASMTPEVVPSPRPDMRAFADRGAMVISPDGTVKFENGPAGSKPARARRAAVSDERDAGGFYAMAPGPDGVMRRQFFPSTPEPGSRQAARAPSRGDIGGVYAMAPGPDGKLEYQFFPDKLAR